MAPQTATQSRSPVRQPVEWPGGGMKASVVARRKCFTGNTSPTTCIHFGASDTGKKTPDRKSSGSMIAFVTAGAASTLGVNAVVARPIEQNAAAPTSSDTTNAGADVVGRSTA